MAGPIWIGWPTDVGSTNRAMLATKDLGLGDFDKVVKIIQILKEFSDKDKRVIFKMVEAYFDLGK